ncbi:hypothetical protein HanIR_Chr07g0300431 [Helianthus annuus]|nr:hypothetical protein HanIR_Chr07g0300431 [Helianthus annuus]
MVISIKTGGYKVEELFVTRQNLVTTTPRVAKSLGRHPLIDGCKGRRKGRDFLILETPLQV